MQRDVGLKILSIQRLIKIDHIRSVMIKKNSTTLLLIIILITLVFATGNNLGFSYSDYGCTLSVDRTLHCNGKGLKGTLYINDLPENLENLYLNDNNITMVQKETFENSRKLRRIYLNNNKLQNFQDKTFAKLENLLILDISNNNIEMFSDNAFSGLLSIIELNVDNNPVSSPTKNCFSNKFLKSKILKFESGTKIKIYVCENKITTCDVKTGCKHTDYPNSCVDFDPITATLDCTNGGYSGKIYLTSVPDRTTSLILKNNFITHIDPRTFDYLEKLVTLDMSDNSLEYLQKDFLLHRLTKLKSFNINNNPILSNSKENRSGCIYDLQLIEIVIDSKKYKWYNCDDAKGSNDIDKNQKDQLSNVSSNMVIQKNTKFYLTILIMIVLIVIA